MSFTAQLGTALSMPGNIALGTSDVTPPRVLPRRIRGSISESRPGGSIVPIVTIKGEIAA